MMDPKIEEFEHMMMDYLKGALKPEDQSRFMEMLRGSEVCRQKYREMSRTYALATSSWFAQRKEQNYAQLREKLDFRTSRKRTIRRHLWIWSTAAVWTLLVVGGMSIWQRKNDTNRVMEPFSYCQIEIPQGATSRVVLPDSTIVILNGGTQLKYDARWQEQPLREVFLTGEAYFQVSPNAKKPFLVHADDLNIKVLGTTFNVSSYSDEEVIKVSLLEGSVKVYTASESQNDRLLSPNQQAIYQKSTEELSVRPVDVTAQVAWTTGKLVFVNERLFDILKAIAKKFDIQIMVQSQKIYEEYFSGTISKGMSLEEILSYLDVDNKFVWRKKGETLVIADR